MSSALVSYEGYKFIFLYLSKGFEWQDLKDLFDTWIEENIPTVIMGDVNWHWNDNHKMKSYLELKNFTQHIRKATHDAGHILDHVYTSHHLDKNQRIFQYPVYFSDHDVINYTKQY